MTSRSISPRAGRLAILVAAIIAAIVVVIVGIRVGQGMNQRPETLQLAGAGPLQAVYLANGSVYLGAIVGDDGTDLRLAGGAVIRAHPGASGEPGVLAVDLLTVTPFNLVGDVLIPKAQIALIANVQPGSDVANAYLRAAGAGGPGPSPSPS